MKKKFWFALSVVLAILTVPRIYSMQFDTLNSSGSPMGESSSTAGSPRVGAGAPGGFAGPPVELQLLRIPLQHASAAEVLKIVRELGVDLSVYMSADSRANVVLVRGVEGRLQPLETLIKELDQPGRQSPQRIENSPSSAFPVPNEDRLTPQLPFGTRYIPAPASVFTPEELELDRRIRQAVAEYRRDEHLGESHPTQVQRHVNLLSAIERAFDLRQQQQTAELDKLRERLRKAEQSVAQRAENRRKIIEERLQTLMNPRPDWPSPGMPTIGLPSPTPQAVPSVPPALSPPSPPSDQ